MTRTRVDFTQVAIRDDFWSPRLAQWQTTLIRTCLDKCYADGRVDNFKKAAGHLAGDFVGPYYSDSDLYKVIEGAAYVLQLAPDPALQAEIDGIIDEIAAAQEPDGYLDTYYTLVAPDQKWSDMEKHEMYCGGHLIEAAVAYYQATGSEVLLTVVRRMVAHYRTVFGTAGRHWVEGHEEIELALLRLAELTGDATYREFAAWLMGQRGHGWGVGMIWDRSEWGPAYCQDDVPVTEIRTAKGHAVRAMYLYTAMTRYAELTGDAEYLAAAQAVWADIDRTKCYITGGVGAARDNEGFKAAFVLPTVSAYAETCAAIGHALFSNELSLATGAGQYAARVEQCLYNGILSGIAQDATHFFYVNPMASVGDHHRSEWFGTSCCPTNLARFLPSIGGYVYQREGEELVVNQYIGNTLTSPDGLTATMTSQFPWRGAATLTLTNAATVTRVRLRVPAWAHTVTMTIADRPLDVVVDAAGYVTVDAATLGTATLHLTFDTPLRLIHADPQVASTRGQVALAKGPLVYCAERVDNPDRYYDELAVTPGARWTTRWQEALAVEQVQVDGLTVTPYFAWDNREPGYMSVWLQARTADQLYREQ